MPSDDLPNENRVGAWMNPPDYTIGPNDLVDEAFQLMQRHRIRHLLVVKDDELVGVVTDHDLRHQNTDEADLTSMNEVYRVGEKLEIADVMTDDVLTATPDDLTADAARIMVENKINCLPVVDDDRVVGILTSTDLLAALVHEVDPDFIAAREAEAS
ncbi:MAG TPA: CBS domain-containing protein [Polyangiaceae bacterium]|nr:CBS domain-containing protein [Polyangiaceae bacterium]